MHVTLRILEDARRKVEGGAVRRGETTEWIREAGSEPSSRKGERERERERERDKQTEEMNREKCRRSCCHFSTGLTAAFRGSADHLRFVPFTLFIQRRSVCVSDGAPRGILYRESLPCPEPSGYLFNIVASHNKRASDHRRATDVTREDR